MKVTIIYAGIGVAGFNTDPPRDDREGVHISHGVGSLVASTKAAGHEVEFIDLRQMSGWNGFTTRIAKSDSNVFGLSISAVDYAPAMKAIYIIKQTNPDAKVIVGGIHPTVLTEMYNTPAITTVVKGEGEVTFPELLHMIDKGMKLPRIVQGKKQDLNKLPFVDREIFDYQKELTKYFAEDHCTPIVTMLAGRGCPYHCKYCQPSENAVFGTPYRMRSPENVLSELFLLKLKYNFKSITFWDDTFTLNRKWIMRFADLYEQSGLGGKIAACTRADLICDNPDIIKRLGEIGVNWLVVGMETGSQRMLDLIGKGTTVEQNIKAATICRDSGINIFATIMFGLPTETNEDIDRTVEMLYKCKPNWTSPFWYVPIPGTYLYDYCAKNDLILNDDKIMHTIERTGVFRPTLKNVDYEYIKKIMNKMLKDGIKENLSKISDKLNNVVNA